MQVQSYLKDGMVDDWNVFEEILDYSYDKIIKSQSEYHPVLFSEAPWNQVFSQVLCLTKGLSCKMYFNLVETSPRKIDRDHV